MVCMGPRRWSWKRFRCLATTPPPLAHPNTLGTTIGATITTHPVLFACFVIALIVAAAAALMRALSSRRRGAPSHFPELSPQRLVNMLRGVELLRALGEPEIEAAVEALEPHSFLAGDVVYRQDEQGDDCFFVIAGECYATSQLHTLVEGTRVVHKKHGVGTVEQVTKEPHITRVVFDKGESHRYVPASLHKLKPVEAVEPRVEEVAQYHPGAQCFFGERALSRVEPRAATVACRTDVSALRLTAGTFMRLRRQQEHKENRLRGCAAATTTATCTHCPTRRCARQHTLPGPEAART